MGDCGDLGLARAEIPGDCCLLPFWTRALHEGWQEVFRVGKRERLLQIREHEFGTSHHRFEGKQLLDQMGGLSMLISIVSMPCHFFSSQSSDPLFSSINALRTSFSAMTTC